MQNHWRNWLQRKKEDLLSPLSNLNFRKKQVYILILYYGAIKMQDSENQKKFLGEWFAASVQSIGSTHPILFRVAVLFISTYRMATNVSIIPLSLLTICYVSIAGSSISVLRASLLFLLRLLVKLLNKHYSTMDLFAVVFWLLLLFDPRFLFHAGGQLSFFMSFFVYPDFF